MLIFRYWYAWNKQPAFSSNSNSVNLFVSVVIPARDEELNITHILSDLQQQSYSSQLFEIIVVNDHSTDQTQQLSEQFSEQFVNFSVIALEVGIEGKKNALSKAIMQAKGELVITLDADCRIGNDWLLTIASFYSQNNYKLIICPLLYKNENSIFAKIQSIENLSLVASGAGASALKKPIMCNGANLAFSKDVYMSEKNRTMPEVASGDDIFLLLSVKKNWPNSIAFLKSESAAAFTNPMINLHSFISQRKRWVSKSKYYTDFNIQWVSIVVLLCCLALIISMGMALFNSKYFLVFFLVFCMKSIPDFLLLRSFSSFFRKEKLLKYFIVTQLVYPVFIVFIAIYGCFGEIEWKKRIYK
jgi:glycosyltransferase involved in cell wall biosynthesis